MIFITNFKPDQLLRYELSVEEYNRIKGSEILVIKHYSHDPNNICSPNWKSLWSDELINMNDLKFSDCFSLNKGLFWEMFDSLK